MWEISQNLQAFSTVVAVGLGVCLCIIYDFVRAVRDYKRSNTVTVFILDILYWLVCAVIVFCFLQLFSNGKPRLFVYTSLAVGFMFCRFTASYYIVKYAKKIMRCITNFKNKIHVIFVNAVGFVLKKLKHIRKKFKKAFNKAKREQKTLEK